MKISEDAISTISLGNLFQCLITLIVRIFCLYPVGIFCVAIRDYCLLIFHFVPLQRAWICLH